MLETLIEKLKEKKLNVVSAVSGALDAVLPVAPFDKVLDVLVAGLQSKNPEVKQQTAMVFLHHEAFELNPFRHSRGAHLTWTPSGSTRLPSRLSPRSWLAG